MSAVFRETTVLMWIAMVALSEPNTCSIKMAQVPGLSTWGSLTYGC